MSGQGPSKYPCVILFLSFSSGILLGHLFDVPAWIVCVGAVVSVGIFLRIKAPSLGPDIVLISFVICAAAFYLEARSLRPFDHITRNIGQIKSSSVTVIGKILDEPKEGRAGVRRFILELETVSDEEACRKVSGRILIRMYTPLEVLWGDVISLNGKIHRPFEFGSHSKTSYREYLKRKGIEYVLSAGRKNPARIVHRNPEAFAFKMTRLRERLLNIFDHYLGPEESYFMGAVILGERSRLSQEIRAVFEQTGTAHILAISGLHVSLVTGIIFILLGFFSLGLKARSILTCLCIVCYAVLIGDRPSVVRAVVMAVVLLNSFVFERRSSGLNALGAAGLILALMDPLSIFDIGFQLSFSAVAAILLFFPLVEHRLSGKLVFERNSFLEKLWHSWAVSLSAWLGVSGIILYYFGYISFSAIFANLVVVPYIGLIIASGLFLLLAGACHSPLAWAVAASLQAELRLLVWLVSCISEIPYLFFEISGVSLGMICVYYSSLLLVWGVLRYFKSYGRN